MNSSEGGCTWISDREGRCRQLTSPTIQWILLILLSSLCVIQQHPAASSSIQWAVSNVFKSPCRHRLFNIDYLLLVELFVISDVARRCCSLRRRSFELRFEVLLSRSWLFWLVAVVMSLVAGWRHLSGQFQCGSRAVSVQFQPGFIQRSRCVPVEF